MVGLIIVVGLLIGVVIAVTIVIAIEGNDDAEYGMRYNNSYRGILAFIYDAGYNNRAEAPARAAQNLKRNMARRKREGKIND